MTRNRRLYILIAAMLILVGLLVEGFQLKAGTMTTGMRHSFPWGLSVSGLEFFAGSGAGALLLICFSYLFGAEKLTPFTGVAAACALANLMAGMLFILCDLGRVSHLYEMFLHPNPDSPLVWDMTVLSLEVLLALIFVYGQVRAERSGSNHSRRRLQNLSVFTIFATVGLPVMAWIFMARVNRPTWRSALLAPDYLIVGMGSGFAITFIASLFTYNLKDKYRSAYRSLAGFILVFVLLHLAFTANEILTRALSGVMTFPWGLELIRHFLGSAYGIEIGTLLLGGVMLFNARVRTNRAAMFIGASLVVIGAFTYNCAMMPEFFNHMPLTVRPLGLPDMTWAVPVTSIENSPPVHTLVRTRIYIPGWGEMAVFAAVCALTILVVMLAVQWLPRPKGQGVEG